MFEDCLPAPKTRDRPSRDKAVAVLVTLTVHGFLGYAVYHGRFTVKILPFEKEEVRNVVIVPPLKVTIPKIVGGQGLVAEPLGVPERPGSSRRARTEAAGQEPPAGGGKPAEPPSAQPALPAEGGGSPVPSLSTKFKESMANRRPSGGQGLSITLAPPGTPAGPSESWGKPPLPDFSKYGRGAFGGIGGYGTGRGRAGGSGSGRQRVGVSIPLKGYDILPWATVVIDRIQRDWVFPAVNEVPAAARVRMVVVIKKSGELDSIEILEGTSVEVLDRAALEAIRSGLPFPALPADFPGDLLEITFEFAYND